MASWRLVICVLNSPCTRISHASLVPSHLTSYLSILESKAMLMGQSLQYHPPPLCLPCAVSRAALEGGKDLPLWWEAPEQLPGKPQGHTCAAMRSGHICPGAGTVMLQSQHLACSPKQSKDIKHILQSIQKPGIFVHQVMQNLYRSIT